MLYVDPAPPKRFARHLERVLIVDPHPNSARMLHELLKDLGASSVRQEQSTAGALAAAREGDPQIVFSELKGPQLDGLELVRQLRRSDFTSRKAPFVMVTAEATAAAIVGARDAGAHEFLRKPFTLKDLTRRVEAVSGKPRDWVEAVRYIGPDRRRFNSGDYTGPRKRRADQAASPEAARLDQALRILKSALGALEADPRQALRAMQAQAADLLQIAGRLGDATLLGHAGKLRIALEAQAKAGRLVRAELEAATQPLWRWLPAEAAA